MELKSRKQFVHIRKLLGKHRPYLAHELADPEIKIVALFPAIPA